jgi:hypothetical protein
MPEGCILKMTPSAGCFEGFHGSQSCSRTALCMPVGIQPIQEVVHHPLSHPVRLQVRLQDTLTPNRGHHSMEGALCAGLQGAWGCCCTCTNRHANLLHATCMNGAKPCQCCSCCATAMCPSALLLNSLCRLPWLQGSTLLLRCLGLPNMLTILPLPTWYSSAGLSGKVQPHHKPMQLANATFGGPRLGCLQANRKGMSERAMTGARIGARRSGCVST